MYKIGTTCTFISVYLRCTSILSYRLHHVPFVRPDSPAVLKMSLPPHVLVAPTPPQDRLPVQLAPLVSHVTLGHPPAVEQDITVPL